MRHEVLVLTTPEREAAEVTRQLTRALLDGCACRAVLARMPPEERALLERFALEARRERELREAGR
jgi:hypothetical protein